MNKAPLLPTDAISVPSRRIHTTLLLRGGLLSSIGTWSFLYLVTWQYLCLLAIADLPALAGMSVLITFATSTTAQIIIPALITTASISITCLRGVTTRRWSTALWESSAAILLILNTAFYAHLFVSSLSLRVQTTTSLASMPQNLLAYLEIAINLILMVWMLLLQYYGFTYLTQKLQQ